MSRAQSPSRPAMSPALLDIRTLTVRYGARVALNRVDLSIERGQVVALLGPNGAGKTTLLESVVGGVIASEGQVLLDGLSVAGRPRQGRRQVGYAPQELAIYPTATVAENVTLWAALRGLSGRSRREAVEDALDGMCLLPMRDRVVRGLSGGERRRVHCAMAVTGRPSLLLLDEPTAGVDPQTRRAVLTYVLQLAARGSGVCYSTHYLPEVEKLGADVVLLDRGIVVASGPVGELVSLGGPPVIELRLGSPDSGGERLVRVSGSDDVPAQVIRLLAEATAQGHVVQGLEIHEPSLEDVFQQIVDRHSIGSPAPT
jgi:ABC-2 type transport system ATP-binding protein